MCKNNDTVRLDDPIVNEEELFMLDYRLIHQAAQKYEKPMVKFLRELVAIPSESGHESRVIRRIQQELRSTRAFDKIWIDPFGNCLARIGLGSHLIAIDAHVDTVGLGDPKAWPHDPYQGKLQNKTVFGRGAGDQKGAIPSMVYAARIIKDLNLKSRNWSLLLAFTVCEEDCEGLNWQYIIRESGIRPECVVVTDCTGCKIMRGQRGRMEIGVTTRGRSCHGSMPEKGDNAIYKIARVISEIERLNTRLKKDKLLGKGTIAVTYVNCRTPSVCAVPDHAYIHLDRRLTAGETKQTAIRQVREAIRRAGVDAKVEILRYKKPTHTGLVCETENYFPTWSISEKSLLISAAQRTYRALFDQKPVVSCWPFSTNAASIAGMFGIPCVGFGPAFEDVPHTTNDSVPIEHLVKCAAFYAAFPQTYCDHLA